MKPVTQHTTIAEEVSLIMSSCCLLAKVLFFAKELTSGILWHKLQTSEAKPHRTSCVRAKGTRSRTRSEDRRVLHLLHVSDPTCPRVSAPRRRTTRGVPWGRGGSKAARNSR